jgi:hypothetical protein
LHWLNLNCASIIGRSFTNFVFFYVDRNSKMTTTAGHSFYIEPIGSFYNQVNDTGSWEPLVYCWHTIVVSYAVFDVALHYIWCWWWNLRLPHTRHIFNIGSYGKMNCFCEEQKNQRDQ